MGVNVDSSSVEIALKQMSKKVRTVRNRALRTAAKFVAEKLEENTPIDPADKNKTHMKEDVTVSGVDQYGEIRVGYGKETYWRVHFVELGTIKQRPLHFIERTEEETRNEFMKIVQEELRKGLGL